MSVRIDKIPGRLGNKPALLSATIDEDGWYTIDPDLLLILEDLSSTVEVAASDPNPYLTIARDIVSIIGGTIAKIDKTEYDPGVIY